MANDVNAGRRKFLGTSVGAGAAAVISSYSENAEAARVVTPSGVYPVIPVAKMDQLHPVTSQGFSYPDAQSPCLLVKLNSAVEGGIGPEKNIVAYSGMCTHMGCFVSYDGGTQTFQCPCHFTVFDPENNGQMVCGHATENLPRIQLQHDRESGQISAVGIEGRLYGRVGNLL